MSTVGKAADSKGSRPTATSSSLSLGNFAVDFKVNGLSTATISLNSNIEVTGLNDVICKVAFEADGNHRYREGLTSVRAVRVRNRKTELVRTNRKIILKRKLMKTLLKGATLNNLDATIQSILNIASRLARLAIKRGDISLVNRLLILTNGDSTPLAFVPVIDVNLGVCGTTAASTAASSKRAHIGLKDSPVMKKGKKAVFREVSIVKASLNFSGQGAKLSKDAGFLTI